MKNIIIIIVTILLITSHSITINAQNKLYALAKANGKWGYIDTNSRFIIPPEYDEANRFVEGMAAVAKNDSLGQNWGFINLSGNIVIPLRYNDVKDFSESFAEVGIGEVGSKKWNFINKEGKTLLKTPYDGVSSFKNGFAGVGKGGSEGYHGEWSFINKKGKEIMSFNISGEAMNTPTGYKFSENLSAVSFAKLYEKAKPSWGYIDTNGNTIIKPAFDWAGNFVEGRAWVNIGGYYQWGAILEGAFGIVDKTGKYIVELQYNSLGYNYNEGIAVVINSNDSTMNFGYIDINGKAITKIEFEEASSFKDGIALVKKNGLYGFINKKGEYVIKATYEDMHQFNEGLCAVKINNKWGFINMEEKFVIEAIYDEVQDFSSSLCAVRLKDKWGYINSSGKLIIKPFYDDCSSFVK